MKRYWRGTGINGASGWLLFLFVAPLLGIMGSHGNAAPLPSPQTKGDTSLEESMAARRSARSFTDEPLSRQQIGQLCWAAQGITDPGSRLRAAPSAGATYPLELYVATAEGVHRYDPDDHALEPHLEEDVRPALHRAALYQDAVKEAPAVFIIAADISRTAARYGERAKRYVLIETGHASQNLLLQAVALGLVGVPIGAFQDDAVDSAINVPEGQQTFYLLPIGHAP